MKEESRRGWQRRALEAPPRTLDVQQFAKARSLELLSLCDALKRTRHEIQPIDQPQAHTSIASPLPRHLRRRTSSYSRRRPLPGLYSKKRKAPVLLLPPKQRKLDPQTSHIASSHVADVPSSDGSKRPLKKRLCRRLRRKLEFKAGRCLVANDGTRRLATHLWHAKRFSMIKRWGYYLPFGRPGRGHGSRAVLRWSKEATLLQDASFNNVIQLQGPQERLLGVLQFVLEPPSEIDTLSEGTKLELSGACYGTAVLHHVGSAPHKLVAPILWAWRPVISEPGNSSLLAGQTENLQERDVWLWVHAAAFEEAFQCLQAACYKVNEDFGDVSVRCFSRRGEFGRIDLLGSKSFEVLQKVTFPVYREQEDTQRNVMKLTELVIPGELPKRAIINMEVFDPRQRQDEQCISLSNFRGFNSKPQVHKLFKRSEENCSEADNLETGSGNAMDENVQSDQVVVGIDPQVKNEEELKELASNLQAMNTLWVCAHNDFGGKLRRPVSEKFLSEMRHINRLACCGLIDEATSNGRMSGKRKALFGRCICPIMLLKHDNQNLSACGWSIVLPLSWVSVFWIPLVFAGGHVIGIRERHWLLTDAGLPSFPDDFPDSPAYADLIITESMGHAKVPFKNANKKRPMPLSVLTHASKSCHDDEGSVLSLESISVVSRSAARDQRESDAMNHASESYHDDEGAALCLESMSVVSRSSAIDQRESDAMNHASESYHDDDGATRSLESMSVVSRSAARDQRESDANGCVAVQSTRFFIARTVARLGMFLQMSCERGLLLFPAQMQIMERFKPLSGRLQEGTVAWHLRSEAHQMDNLHKTENICYLRVCIYLFRKGILEVGAMVYAPTSEDYNFWSSKKDSHKKQCMDFTSGNGQTTSICCSSRNPIGFVTSVAPRGSKNKSGIAFCNAVVLGQIRAKQWVKTKWHNDQKVFVMTRNSGSNTYRPGFASIALEEGQDIL